MIQQDKQISGQNEGNLGRGDKGNVEIKQDEDCLGKQKSKENGDQCINKNGDNSKNDSLQKDKNIHIDKNKETCQDENKNKDKNTVKDKNTDKDVDADPKNRPHTPLPDKTGAKKKRKLLSFDDQLVEQPHQQKVRIKNQKQNNRQISGNIQEQLKKQFMQKIQKLKDQLFQIDYSYWDGPSLVQKLKRKKGQTIKDLLECCRLQLISNFQSLASIKANDLLMVIKDCIVPHKMTIAELEALQLKTGKGEYLINFKHFQIKDIDLSVNVQGCIRIIQRSRYERNINAYPFNTWREINIDQ